MRVLYLYKYSKKIRTKLYENEAEPNNTGSYEKKRTYIILEDEQFVGAVVFMCLLLIALQAFPVTILKDLQYLLLQGRVRSWLFL